jgi:hypothetical protein
MNMFTKSLSVISLPITILLASGCEEKREISPEQYKHWTRNEQALRSVQRNDLLILSNGRVCIVENNSNRSVFIEANCKDGTPNWKHKQELATYLEVIIQPGNAIYDSYAAQYLSQ